MEAVRERIGFGNDVGFGGYFESCVLWALKTKLDEEAKPAVHLSQKGCLVYYLVRGLGFSNHRLGVKPDDWVWDGLAWVVRVAYDQTEIFATSFQIETVLIKQILNGLK